jgi:FkbM family methyltransferase
MTLPVFERLFRKLGYYSEQYAARGFKPEPAAFQFYCQYLQSEDIVVEAGAFRGWTTVGFLVNMVKFVYAIEPNPDSFKHLRKNCRRYENSKVKTINVGLGDREEVAVMHGGAESWATFCPQTDSSPRVKARLVSLDSLNLDPSPTVLILDCEGMEVRAIKGAEKTIAKSVHSVLVETHGGTEPEVKDILSRNGFANIQTRQSGWNKPGAYHDKWVVATRS